MYIRLNYIWSVCTYNESCWTTGMSDFFKLWYWVRQRKKTAFSWRENHGSSKSFDGEKLPWIRTKLVDYESNLCKNCSVANFNLFQFTVKGLKIFLKILSVDFISSTLRIRSATNLNRFESTMMSFKNYLVFLFWK